MKRFSPTALFCAALIFVGCVGAVHEKADVPTEQTSDAPEPVLLDNTGESTDSNTASAVEFIEPETCDGVIRAAEAGTTEEQAIVYDGQCHDRDGDGTFDNKDEDSKYEYYTVKAVIPVRKVDNVILFGRGSTLISGVTGVCGHTGILGPVVEVEGPSSGVNSDGILYAEPKHEFRKVCGPGQEPYEWALIGNPPPPYVSITSIDGSEIQEGTAARFRIKATDAHSTSITTFPPPRQSISVNMRLYNAESFDEHTTPALSFNVSLPATTWTATYTLNPGGALPLNNDTPDADVWRTLAVFPSTDGSYNIVGDWEFARIRVVDPEDDEFYVDPDTVEEPDFTQDELPYAAGVRETPGYCVRVGSSPPYTLECTDSGHPPGELRFGWSPPMVDKDAVLSHAQNRVLGYKYTLTDVAGQNTIQTTGADGKTRTAAPQSTITGGLPRSLVVKFEGIKYFALSQQAADAGLSPNPIPKALPDVKPGSRYRFTIQAVFQNSFSVDGVAATQETVSVRDESNAANGRLVIETSNITGYLGPVGTAVGTVSAE